MLPTFDPWVHESVCSDNAQLQEGLTAIEVITRDVLSLYNHRQEWELPFLPTSCLSSAPEDVFMSRMMSSHLVGAIHLGETLGSIIQSINARYLFQAALSVRSLIEIVASFVYFENRVVKPLREKPEHPPDEYAKILDFLIDFNGTGRFDWLRWQGGEESVRALMQDYSADKKKALPERQQTNVMTMLAALEKRITERWPPLAGRTELQYALLSDLCHPSVGRHLVVFENYRVHESPEGPVPVFKYQFARSDRKVRWFLINTTVPMVSQHALVGVDVLKNVFGLIRDLEASSLKRENQK